MKVVQINATCGLGSTGKICMGISEILTAKGIENYILFCSGSSDYPLAIKYTNNLYIKLQSFFSHLNGKYGFNSNIATDKLIAELDKINPDIIHLHNIHGHNCNLSMLFKYVRDKKINLYWTFHDCWAFTAYCTHFTRSGCNKWMTKCYECPQRKKFSFFLDRSSYLYTEKEKAIQGLNLTVVTPSKWLSDLVKKSFFKNNNIRIINNGINLEIFKPVESSFRDKYNISCGKKIVLGVAFNWGSRKGLDVFNSLATSLDCDKYQIVLVGTNPSVKKQISEKIITIDKTSNQSELAEIYSSADLFVNPTREDTFPTVNIEALACGTPVLTFRTGGSPEIIDKTCGCVVECDDIDALKYRIVDILENDSFSVDDCVKRASKYNERDKYYQYYELYKEISGKRENT